MDGDPHGSCGPFGRASSSGRGGGGGEDMQPELPHPTRHVTGDRGGTSTLFDCFTVGRRTPIFIQRLCFVHVCLGFFLSFIQ